MCYLSSFVQKGKRPRLVSICIPTCNRAAKLDSLLANISSELGGIRGQVEICISDNGSTDNTAGVIRKWGAKLPIKAHFSQDNMGYDINAFYALKMAGGEFAMFIGDDDGFVQGSLAMLVHDLGSIRARNAGAVYLNHFVGNGALTDFGFEGIRQFKVKDGGFPPLNIGFGGSICVRMGEARKALGKIYVDGKKLCKKEADPFLLYDFVHSYIFAECARSSGSLAIEPSPVVKVIAEGASLSVEKWFYLDSVFSLYYIQMKMFYPEIEDDIFGSSRGVAKHCLKRYFAMAYLIIGRPQMRDLFEMNREVHLDILRLEGDGLAVSLLSALERLRRAGILNPPIVAAVWMYRLISGNRNFLTEQKDTLNKPNRQIGELAERIGVTRRMPGTLKKL